MFQLITEAAVPQQHADWSSSGPDESCNMDLLSAAPRLRSACGQPAYTNYVGGFHGCLDYIFIQPDQMQVLIPAKAAAQIRRSTTASYLPHASQDEIDRPTPTVCIVLLCCCRIPLTDQKLDAIFHFHYTTVLRNVKGLCLSGK